jgi:succinate-semialdehyde dehydrogenase/glutarate-semialdehyde dehydrogenase
MSFKSTNPYNSEPVYEIPLDSKEQMWAKVVALDKGFYEWRKSSFEQRSKLLNNLAALLLAKKQALAKACTLEMGKPIKEAISEVEKCAWVCNYYAENGQQFLKDTPIKIDGQQTYVTYDPLGCILAIMPWNFPFWQVFRFVAPNLMAGNTIAMKHASSVPKCAELIEQLIIEAGYSANVYKNLFVNVSEVEPLLADTRIKAVTLTGSVKAGSSVAKIAGANIKKSVLELGGSSAFIVMEGADIEKAVAGAVLGRFLNGGQSCIAAKRILIHASIYNEFEKQFLEKVTALKIGNPLSEDVKIGPMARIDLAEQMEQQMNDSVKLGAKILLGGKRESANFEPTILTNVTSKMPVYREEIFGPCAVLIPFNTIEEAIEISNNTEYGLGCSIYTENPDKYLQYIPQFDEGGVFFNSIVKSDPRVPFGGVKKSGFGRELGEEGIKEFVNKKTVYIA